MNRGTGDTLLTYRVDTQTCLRLYLKGCFYLCLNYVVHWCAIVIAHQLLWQNVEAPVSIFHEYPLAGEPRERLFHIHSLHRYQLCTKYLYPPMLL